MDKRLRQQRLDFHRLVIASHDFDAAVKAFELITRQVTDINDSLYQPLLFGALVSYAKPFVANNMLGILPKRWSQFEDPAHRTRHAAMIEARHEIAAHNDADLFEITILPPGTIFTFGEEKHVTDVVNYSLRAGYAFNLDTIPGYLATCEFQLGRVYDELSTLKEEVLTDEERAWGHPFTFRLDGPREGDGWMLSDGSPPSRGDG